MRVWELAANLTWAIEPGWLQVILQVANREPVSPEAVAALSGPRLDPSRRATLRDGVAILPVHRAIFRRANLFTEISGATSIEILAQDLHTAAADSTVRAILLDIDSPGGEANGVGELARMVAELRARKPVHAYVGHQCCSGAYWLAAACDSIVVDPTAVLGSIGVVAVHRLGQARDQVEIVSSQSPNKRPDLETEAGRRQVQETVDAIAAVFIADVARCRNLSPDQVVERFGAGGVKVGAAAVAAGMADRLGDFEGLLRELSSPRTPERSMRTMEDPTTTPAALDEAAISAAAAPPELGAGGPSSAASPPDSPQNWGAGGAELDHLRAELENERSLRQAAEADRALLTESALRRELLDQLAGVRVCDGRLALTPASREALVGGLLTLSTAQRAPLMTALQEIQLVQFGEAGFPAEEPVRPKGPQPERVKELAAMTPLGKAE